MAAKSANKRAEPARSKLQIAFRYRAHDTIGGVTRQTTKLMAELLGMDETQVIHRALREMAVKVLPNYERDDGPLTVAQIREIRRVVPQGTKRSVSSSLFDVETA